jgi:hypothetical protein
VQRFVKLPMGGGTGSDVIEITIGYKILAVNCGQNQQWYKICNPEIYETFQND